MSENENENPAPSHQTSSVPLKKETVRVTLKASDAPAAPSASTAPPAPVRPPVPTAPPAPTVGAAPRPPAPAPTIPLRTAGAPAGPATPAPTIRLATSTAPVGGAARPGGAPTMALPKATVPLQTPTQGASPSQMATLQVDDDDEAEGGEGLINGLAIAGFVAALVVLVLQLMSAGVWINAEDNPQQGIWSQLLG